MLYCVARSSNAIMCEKKTPFESFKLTRVREIALRQNGPDILKTLKLTPIFFSYLTADFTLTDEMEQEISVKRVILHGLLPV